MSGEEPIACQQCEEGICGAGCGYIPQREQWLGAKILMDVEYTGLDKKADTKKAEVAELQSQIDAITELGADRDHWKQSFWVEREHAIRVENALLVAEDALKLAVAGNMRASAAYLRLALTSQLTEIAHDGLICECGDYHHQHYEGIGRCQIWDCKCRAYRAMKTATPVLAGGE